MCACLPETAVHVDVDSDTSQVAWSEERKLLEYHRGRGVFYPLIQVRAQGNDLPGSVPAEGGDDHEREQDQPGHGREEGPDGADPLCRQIIATGGRQSLAVALPVDPVDRLPRRQGGGVALATLFPLLPEQAFDTDPRLSHPHGSNVTLRSGPAQGYGGAR